MPWRSNGLPPASPWTSRTAPAKRLTGTVVAASPSELTVECSALAVEEKPDIRLVLVQALAKGDRDELAVETATELGIDAVFPWQSERSIVRWKGERAAKAHAKWQSVATAAAKQARRAWIPEVRAAVETPGLAAQPGAADLAVILHEDAVRPLRSVLEAWHAAGGRQRPPRNPAHCGAGGRDQSARSDQAVRCRRRDGTPWAPCSEVLHCRTRRGGACQRRAGPLGRTCRLT